MFELLRDLSDWTTGFAESDWSALILAAASFAESIFFPIPPDPLLLAIAIPQPHAALWLAALVTASSVAGAVVGHWLGHRFGRPLLYRFASGKKVEAVEKLFRKYGAWAVLIAAFTPIPYKVFAISAGVLDMNLRTFIFASIIGRGARFFILGGLIFVYGEDIERFIDTNFELVTGASAGALVVAVAVAAIIVRRRRTRDTVG
ncbi:MAG: DedA family protein [Chloroflexi bacterium]|nr:DedA family protein [Chloroflexota bacterium]